MSVWVNRAFLPKMHINRNMPRAVVYGPKRWGGLGLNTDMYCLQAQCAITYLVRVLRWDKTVANDIITALNAIQMLSGFETPLLEDPTVEIAYKGTGWILNLRAMMGEYEMSLSIEHIRVPQRQ
eukprot:scaffold381631_cov66-Cyclotella_meneghiniana.AAC.1